MFGELDYNMKQVRFLKLIAKCNNLPGSWFICRAHNRRQALLRSYGSD